MTYHQDKILNSGILDIENAIKMEYVDKIEDILALTDPVEMDNRIFKNTINITKILKIFYKKLCDNFQIGKDETDILISVLNLLIL